MQIRHSNSFLKIPITFSQQQKTAPHYPEPRLLGLVTQPRLRPSPAQCLGYRGHVSLSAEVRLRYASMIGRGEGPGGGARRRRCRGRRLRGGRLRVGFDPRR